MQKFLEATGDTRDEAIQNALRQLGLDRDDVSVEVLDNGRKGFLGIGATPARVRVTYEVPDELVKKEEPVHKTVEKPAAEKKPAERPAKKNKPAQKKEKPAEKPQKLSITDEDDTPRLVKAAPPDFVPEKLEVERPPRRERPRRERGGRRERRPREECPVTPSVPKERELIPVSEEGMKKAEQLATDFITGLLEKMGVWRSPARTWARSSAAAAIRWMRSSILVRWCSIMRWTSMSACRSIQRIIAKSAPKASSALHAKWQ